MSEGEKELRATVRVLTRLSRFLDRTETGLSLSQYRILTMVDRGDERSSQLASRLTVSKPSITVAVDALVESGLLRRTVDAEDRRAARLRMTAAGRKALVKADAAFAERLEPVLGGVSDPKRLIALLHEVNDVLDARHEQRIAERKKVPQKR